MTGRGQSSKDRRGKDQPRQSKRQRGQAKPIQPQPHTPAGTTSKDSYFPHSTSPAIPQNSNAPFQNIEIIDPATLYAYDANTMDWSQPGSADFSSMNTPTSSWQSIGTPSGYTDSGTMGGYEMVPGNRSYSNGSGSNGTSGGSSDQALLPPPWTPGAECRVDTEARPWYHGAALEVDREEMAMDDNLALRGINSQHQMLIDLQRPKTHTVYDPYQPWYTGSSDGGSYPEQSGQQYCLDPSPQMSTTGSSSFGPRIQDGSADPWNQCDPRVAHFTPGQIVFETEPGPAGEEYYTQNLLNQPLAALQSPMQSPKTSKSMQSSHTHKKSRSSTANPARGSAKAGSNDQAGSPGWEIMVVRKHGWKFISECGEQEAQPQPNGRTRKLDKKKTEKVARVRRLGACRPCWLSKSECSEEEICKRCLDRQLKHSPTADQLCIRGGFCEYEVAFFPDWLHLHFSKCEIKKLVDDNSVCYLPREFDVQVSVGALFEPPMTLSAQLLLPNSKTSELLSQHHLTDDFLRRNSAPVGLMNLSTPELKKTCRKYVEEMVANPRYAEQVTLGDPNEIPRWILETVRKYSEKTDNTLVRNALMLHAMHYIMGILITFTDESAAKVTRRMHQKSSPEPYLSSRLLNRQVKYIVHKLHRDLTTSVLQDLEKSMRSRTRDAWGPSFAAILILCLCIEGLQTAADTFVVCDIKKASMEGKASLYSREEHSMKACQQLDEFPFQQCTRLFHEIYRSHREGTGGFNPLRAGEGDLGVSLDGPTQSMVRDVQWIMEQHSEELWELSHRPTLLDPRYFPEPTIIRRNNTGRLAAKFLTSFLKEN